MKAAKGVKSKTDSDMAAMSLTPEHFLTSWTIILSFPPSPVSPESCNEMGGPLFAHADRRVTTICVSQKHFTPKPLRTSELRGIGPPRDVGGRAVRVCPALETVIGITGGSSVAVVPKACQFRVGMFTSPTECYSRPGTFCCHSIKSNPGL